MNPDSAQERSPAPPYPAFLAHLRTLAGADRVMSFRDYVAAALYAPGLGYYQRHDLTRVGRHPAADFYTSSSLQGEVFGKLLRAAATSLLSPDSPSTYALVEIGAELGHGVFGQAAAPFAKVETRRLGDSLSPPSQAVIFANEWLDAQPFHRFVFRERVWHELGVRLDGEVLLETVLPGFSASALPLQQVLPKEAPEEYHLDISLDAEKKLAKLIAGPWRGAVIFADYGHDWKTLLHERPAGTARAYYRHQVSSDLLAHPGEQDITCHVCWDRLEAVLRAGGFETIKVEHQESFFMRLAAAEIEKILSTQPGQFSRDRQTLLELLHPAHLGQKFQILSARRL